MPTIQYCLSLPFSTDCNYKSVLTVNISQYWLWTSVSTDCTHHSVQTVPTIQYWLSTDTQWCLKAIFYAHYSVLSLGTIQYWLYWLSTDTEYGYWVLILSTEYWYWVLSTEYWYWVLSTEYWVSTDWSSVLTVTISQYWLVGPLTSENWLMSIIQDWLYQPISIDCTHHLVLIDA